MLSGIDRHLHDRGVRRQVLSAKAKLPSPAAAPDPPARRSANPSPGIQIDPASRSCPVSSTPWPRGRLTEIFLTRYRMRKPLIGPTVPVNSLRPLRVIDVVIDVFLGFFHQVVDRDHRDVTRGHLQRQLLAGRGPRKRRRFVLDDFDRRGLRHAVTPARESDYRASVGPPPIDGEDRSRAAPERLASPAANRPLVRNRSQTY